MSYSSTNSLVQFQEIYPSLGSQLTLYMLESFAATVKLKSPYPAAEIQVQIWTNTLNKFNSEGLWSAIDLEYTNRDETDTYMFQGGFLPTSPGNYQFTYRIRLNNQENKWQWAGGFGENGYLKVEAPSAAMTWTQGPNHVEFLPRVYVGNLIAASQAEQLKIDAVLNLASEFNLAFSASSNVLYKKISLIDGAQNFIPDHALLESINWIESQVKQGKKVLINCRAGIGRSGSISIGYCFYKNRHWTYQETLDYIWSKKADIYPHKHLQETLERLFPRSE
ncbi:MULTISPECIES: dual specificity protein phosphatase family protein [Calothrix]|uniref:Dual specificity protein phosphatase family protein n=2 Tax=Calothrix TaxID=1186 RepID=A0ABR8A598_9CYAN|nr:MULTISPECIES: dual specificity protein phosphatase [Calothrix]MBD2195141.1 dual specificity protein phosphatase family protein [Calothrix parietina FACHB-288]MBD2223739.1 dual specificity protein phosphatase family protein [Calothrix anomala FACHB-343]